MSATEQPTSPVETHPSVPRWRLKRRLNVRPVDEATALVVALVAAFLLCAGLVAGSGESVTSAYGSLLDGAFGSRAAVIETLVQATPLIFTGLAAGLAFRAEVWNIGGEGQFFAGAMGAFLVVDLWGDTLPRGIMIPLLIIAAALAGMLWAAVAGVLYARYQANEIITTVMLNFIILFILSYLLGGPWQAENTFFFQTERLPEAAELPTLVSGRRLHLGFLLAVALAVVVSLVINRTVFGYELRSLGSNRIASAYKGINVARTVVVVMMVSGAIAGIAGASELAGVQQRLQLEISNNFGFVGIIIALVGRLRPAGIVAAAICFGALANGATTMQIQTRVPAALVDVVQGVVLAAVLLAAVAVRYRVAKVEMK